MAASLPLAAAREVLGYFPLLGVSPALTPLGNRGGFSGASLRRVDAAGSSFCLRAWPASDPSPERLQTIHGLMALARQSSLSFIPSLWPTQAGDTWVEHGGRLWEIASWMPGRADFRECPSRGRLEDACTSLARLHTAWTPACPAFGPCPAVLRRLDRVSQWSGLLATGWRPAPDAQHPVQPWAERAWRLLPPRLEQIPRQLAPWVDQRLPLQACLCDIWHDHVLFEGDTVTGLVDFGGVKPDHVAVDLARLLGSLVEDDAEERVAGLRAYARCRPLSADDHRLVAALDETGTVLGLANWLRWLYGEHREFEDRQAVARRMAGLVTRIEGWASGECPSPLGGMPTGG